MNINMLYIICIFITFFVKKILLSIDILEKYSSISTYNDSIIFNSTDFSNGDIMSFKFGTNNSENYYNNNTCEEQLEYQYYDTINNITDDNYTLYSIKAALSEKDNSIRYFNINKTETELNGLEGNYLLLIFNCNTMVTIENIREKAKKLNEEDGSQKDYIVSIVFVILFIIFIIICLRCCCTDMKQSCNSFGNCVICCCKCCTFTSSSPFSENASNREASSQRGPGAYIYSRNRQIPPQSPASSVDIVSNQ